MGSDIRGRQSRISTVDEKLSFSAVPACTAGVEQGSSKSLFTAEKTSPVIAWPSVGNAVVVMTPGGSLCCGWECVRPWGCLTSALR